MSTFSTRRNAGTDSLKKLLNDIKKTEKKFVRDDRFWKLTTDKAGNGRAIIRFLPDPDGEFFVNKYTHSVQGPGGWYIENCLTTFGEADPCCEINNDLWNTGIDENRKIASKQKRRLVYVSNIVVLKDPAAPENNGKVFLFEYGKKIFEQIKRQLEPEFDEVQPVNPFSADDGADFVLIAAKQGGSNAFRNYDQSKFNNPSPLFGGDDVKIEAALSATHKIAPIVARDQFKTYDVLKKKLTEVLGGRGTGGSAPVAEQAKPQRSAPPSTQIMDDEDDTSVVGAAASGTSGMDDEDEDDPSKYFQNLADD